MGCVLSDSERRVTHNSFDLSRITPFVREYLHSFSLEASPDEIQIAMGQADHFLLRDGKEDEIVRWVADLLPGSPLVASITVSAIGKPSQIAKKVSLWKSAIERYKQPVNIDLVFDPVKMSNDRFFINYQENFSIIKSVFGDVDLNINVGPDTIKALKPAELINLVRNNTYRRLTLNLTPTVDSSEIFRSNMNDISAWFLELANSWDFSKGFNINFVPSLAIYIEDQLKDGSVDLRMVASRLERRLLHELYITNDYSLTNVQSGFGDIALSSRHGLMKSVRLDGSQPALPLAKAVSRKNATALSAHILSDPRCAQCSFAATCLQTGGAVLGRIVRSDGLCPSGLKPVMDFVKTIVEGNLDINSASYHNKMVDVPSFFPRSMIFSPVSQQSEFVDFSLFSKTSS